MYNDIEDGIFICFGCMLQAIRISSNEDDIKVLEQQVSTLNGQINSMADRQLVLEANINAVLTDYYVENFGR